MTDYVLAIGVYGPGEDPNHRSHWGFLLFKPNSAIGNLLHVSLISASGLVYQYDRRDGVPLESQSCEGRVLLDHIKAAKYEQVVEIIGKEPAPRNNKDRCQDWIVECVIALESEELISPGLSTWVSGLVGKSAKELAQIAEDAQRWTAISRYT